MDRPTFQTHRGTEIPAVNAEEMREVDRVAVDEIGLRLLQMMENAGRTLATQVTERWDDRAIVVAGNGGNGGGGMVCARHLTNHGLTVDVLLDRRPDELTGAAATQYRILEAMDVSIHTDVDTIETPNDIGILIDALIGYGLSGEVRDNQATAIAWMNQQSDPILSLDIPAGVDATTGEALGVAVDPARILTLALPKTGLQESTAPIRLLDIGIPETVYDRVGIAYDNPFDDEYWVELTR